MNLNCDAGVPPALVNNAAFRALVDHLEPGNGIKVASTFSENYIPAEAARVTLLAIADLKKQYNLNLGYDGGTTLGQQSIYTVHVTTPDREVYFIKGDEASGFSHTGVHIKNLILEIVALRWHPVRPSGWSLYALRAFTRRSSAMRLRSPGTAPPDPTQFSRSRSTSPRHSSAPSDPAVAKTFAGCALWAAGSSRGSAAAPRTFAARCGRSGAARGLPGLITPLLLIRTPVLLQPGGRYARCGRRYTAHHPALVPVPGTLLRAGCTYIHAARAVRRAGMLSTAPGTSTNCGIADMHGCSART
ncbi:hypothetical protein C8R44DRAFT_879076 [Mycena epipterygia]|nr:hypothetical protein C8R44DRAFT_879076 [Mycena epipterygia]